MCHEGQEQEKMKHAYNEWGGDMMNSDNNEMNKLKKKLAILIVITAVFTALGMATSMGGFGDSLVFGFVAGFMFYIPGRLKGILNTGWLGAIILGVLFNVLFVFLMDKLGILAGIIYFIIPLADIGYSIYKVAGSRRNG